ncbi:acyl-CoA dehydrogenase family protein [Curtobacterium sp. Leaf261]|uniref:acyl-CoA dehydrogenase family protein n=1 Tax=Curtobacterium sp. Leaf261 TaxID=1736311 RepID=UPI0006FA41F2|nr:acyl-CoA dehydrogenase family protein [Curtobacterium sp. Leaf261]KQO62286.1 hypothetical protein ASF23_10795 [Curtobacterium sp. Leaf261]
MLASPAWPPSTTDVAFHELADTAGRVGAAPVDRLAFATWLGGHTARLAPGTAGAFLATLVAVGDVDVALARTVEPHLDALGILAQAGVHVPADAVLGVFAAEAPGLALTATAVDGATGADDATPVLLAGTKPWCSLASSLTHALVTAHVGSAGGAARGLFLVDLRHPGVTTHDDRWVARGMPDVPSAPVDFDDVPATPVGDPGWYLSRPGFAWGGIGVAACWYGGALGLARTLRTWAAAHADSELAQHALGATVLDLQDAEDALAGAAALIDGHADAGTGAGAGAEVDWSLVAQTVRSRVRAACDRIRTRTVSTIGPAPLTTDPVVAARVADLELYLLQDHGDRDVARVGRIVLDRGGLAW